MVAFCGFIVSLECANHVYNHWIIRLVSYCYLDDIEWPCRRLGGRIFLAIDILYVFLWNPAFTLVFPICPTDCSRVDAQEKAKEIKKDAEMKNLHSE